MRAIFAASIAAMLLLEAAPWARSGFVYGAVLSSTLFAVVALQSWKRALLAWIVNFVAALFGAFFVVPALYWGMRLTRPLVPPGAADVVFNYVVAAAAAAIVVLFSWLPIRGVRLFWRR